MGVSVRTARRAARDLDRRRAQFDRTMHRANVNDPHSFDLVLDTHSLGLEIAAEVVVQTIEIGRTVAPAQETGLHARPELAYSKPDPTSAAAGSEDESRRPTSRSQFGDSAGCQPARLGRKSRAPAPFPPLIRGATVGGGVPYHAPCFRQAVKSATRRCSVHSDRPGRSPRAGRAGSSCRPRSPGPARPPCAGFRWSSCRSSARRIACLAAAWPP